jgi:hypothetical protein
VVSVILYAWLFALASGCGEKGPTRYALSGRVTYRGTPVPAGTITFEPTHTVVNMTTIGEANIDMGRYQTLPNKGVVGGPHKVFISGYNGIPEPGSGPMGASIFATHMVEVELPEKPSTYDFEVPASVPAMGSR